MTTREQKFRQAAFVYLHVGILYEAAAFAMWQNGILPTNRGPAWLYLVLGAAIVAVVFWALWKRQSAWAARIVWGIAALRLPALIEGAFFGGAAQRLPSSFYLVALLVVVINLVMLARAGWD
ncbi:MAG: hypothetical protein ACREMQ_17865, partial [Longimicrobiales bacterium]